MLLKLAIFYYSDKTVAGSQLATKPMVTEDSFAAREVFPRLLRFGLRLEPDVHLNAYTV